MTREQGREERVDRYLFDPRETPVGEVVAMERALAPLRHRPTPLPRPAPRRRAPRLRWLAAAAALVPVALAGAGAWLWSWPAGKGWEVVEGPAETLPVGAALALPPRESLLVRVARIGWMRVEGGSDLTLLATSSNRHRLTLREGALHVGVWAPPGSVRVRTPAGEVADLGCEFLLEVRGGATSVEVTSGWVQLENAWGESIVPAGASSRMTAERLPSVPVYRDADPSFQAAVRALERDGGGAAVDAVVTTARPRDVLTLLVLAARGGEGRETLVARAAELAPPSRGELADDALRGDRRAIWDWIGELPLPPPKRWLPNWRDRRPGPGAEHLG